MAKKRKNQDKSKKYIWLLGSGLFASLSLAAYLLMGEILPYRLGMQRHVVDGDGGYDSTDMEAEFHGQRVQVPERYDVDLGLVGKTVLGKSDSDVEKKIEVDLAKQMLYAKEDGVTVAEFQVSTGKWGRTPTGTFRIWTKFVATKMEGGSRELNTYYYLPNVPFTMYFYNDEIPMSRGYGIHGAYWHSNFGETMSHGCVNMRTRDVEKLFYWAGPDIGEARSGRATEDNPGTEIVIYGEAK